MEQLDAAMRHGADLERIAADLAQAPDEPSDAALDWLIERALRCWHLADATFWQRVKFRTRLLRALANSAGAAANGRRNAAAR